MSDDFIAVHGHWAGLPTPVLLGRLYSHRVGVREIFDFEFDSAFLRRGNLVNLSLDPRLGFFEGRQFPAQGQETFGVFADSSPDRLGRLLMRRRLERAQRVGAADPKSRLFESDYLLGVHDAFRVGALRFRRNDEGAFLDDQHHVAAPPFVQLRALEAASLALAHSARWFARWGSSESKRCRPAGSFVDCQVPKCW